MFPHVGFPELILILVIALVIFGPGKLPDIGRSLGKTIREFRKSSREIIDDLPEASAQNEDTPVKKQNRITPS